MTEQYPAPPEIIETNRQIADGMQLHCQFSPAAAIGRLVMITPGETGQNGIFGYNLRTGGSYTTDLHDYQEDRSATKLINTLLRELGDAGVDLVCPKGYPEVAELTDAIRKTPPVPVDELKAGDYFLYEAIGYHSEREFRVFQSDGVEPRRDGFDAPFTAALYRLGGLGLQNCHAVQFVEDGYQPYIYNDFGHFDRCAAATYGDESLPYVRPEHFRIMSTGQTFYPVTAEQALAVAAFIEPDWPAITYRNAAA